MALPKLSVGHPVDFSADVPIFPPFAMGLTVGVGCLLWRATGIRLGFLPSLLQPLWVRVAVLATGLGATKVLLLDAAGPELAAAGSGTFFTPVGGLATSGIYASMRNPMYTGLVFGAVPTLSVVLNSAWPLLLDPALFLYLGKVVIAAEERLLSTAFGAQYTEYCKRVPRWLGLL